MGKKVTLRLSSNIIGNTTVEINVAQTITNWWTSFKSLDGLCM